MFNPNPRGNVPHGCSSFPQCEALEARQLLSATLDRGLLEVKGTNKNDTIVVMREKADPKKTMVKIGRQITRFKTAAIKRISIEGLNGNDVIKIDQRNGRVPGAATILGGNGDDVITGGYFNDVIEGGPGDDNILGAAGHDFILGGDGDDFLNGGGGNDMIYGDAGNDTLLGGAGADILGGDSENALHLSGKAKPARAVGHDILMGGAGNDYLLGGSQSDTYDDDNGRDTMTGGPGNDIIDARTKFLYPGPVAVASTQDVITDLEPGDRVPQTQNHNRPLLPGEVDESAYDIHVHTYINIIINDNGTNREVVIPIGVGDFNQIPRTHTHATEEGGNIWDHHFHVHSLDPYTPTLKEFLENWGITFDSRHIGRYVADAKHKITMTVNGQVNTDYENYLVKSTGQFIGNKWENVTVDSIIIRYT